MRVGADSVSPMTAGRAVSDVDGTWRPKLVVLDLDGTVVANRSGPPRAGETRPGPSRAVREALAAVAAAGVPVVVATGRSLWAAEDTVTALGLPEVGLVCSNGAVGYDLVRRRELFLERFAPDAAMTALASALPGAGFAVERGTRGFVTTPEFARDFTSRFLDVASIADAAAEPTTRVVCRAGHHAPEAVLDAAERVLPGTGARWYSQRPGWLDLGPADCSKATGVARLAVAAGVDASDVAAFGDDHNDIDLLNWAGGGVAMGQAPEAVRRAATLVTGPVSADGVATALARWFPPVKNQSAKE